MGIYSEYFGRNPTHLSTARMYDDKVIRKYSVHFVLLTGNKSINHDYNSYLIIINVTHISMFRYYFFTFGQNVTKCGRNMERRWEHNIAEPKFELKSSVRVLASITVAATSKR